MIFNNLVNKIYEEDFEFQNKILTRIAKEIRRLPSPKVLLDNKMFYVLDDNYLPSKVGDFITDNSLGLYKNGACKGLYKLWIPIYDFNDDIVGFAWYSDGSIEKQQNIMHIKYRLQIGTFIKNRFMNIRRHTYKKAIEDGYLVVCDGFFDKYHFEHYGINSASILGSDLTDYRLFYLSFIKHIILFMDNDEAGVGLSESIQQLSPNSIVTIIKQGVGKDADDYMKEKGNPIKIIQEVIDCPPLSGERTI